MDKFVLNVPEWHGELVFSKEILILAGVVLLIVVGVLFCFWGYKYFGTILFIGIGAILCYGCFLLVEPMTGNSVIRLFLTVSLTFLGLCFVYFLSIILGFILDKLRIRTALAKRSYLFAAPLGAAILGLTIYFMIWRDVIVAGAIAAVCLVVGLIFQHSRRNKQVRFRSYNDLLKLQRPDIDDSGLEFISLEDEDAAAAGVKEEPKPIAEPAVIAAKAEAAPEIVVAAVVAAKAEEEEEPEPITEPAVVEAEEEAEPEPIAELAKVEAEYEEELESVETAVVKAELEPELVSELTVVETEAESEPEPVSEPIVVGTELEPEPEPESVKQAVSKPTKISIRMELKTSEIEVDISKEEFLLRRKKNTAKEKDSVSAPDKNPEWKFVAGAAILAFGLGVLYYKTSKGRD